MPRPIKKQIWNNIDAIGLLNGISIWDDNFQNLKYVRIPDETNIELRHKINNFNSNPIRGKINEQLMIGLANELNLDSYSLEKQTSFALTRTPIAVDDIGVQDIFVYYRLAGSVHWNDLSPQLWSASVQNTVPTSGFMVWEDSYYTDDTNTNSKNNTYSNLIEIYQDLPHMTDIKIVYSIRVRDIDDNEIIEKFTDINNSTDPSDHSYTIIKPYDPTMSDLLNHAVVYNMGDIPVNYSGHYYDTDGKAKNSLYEIQDLIDDKYRTRWINISDKNTVWDINTNFVDGVIPSFYDEGFNVGSGDYIELANNLTGGVAYHNTSLYITGVHSEVINNIEHWYPIVQSGPFYVSGNSYYLMNNTKNIQLDLTSGSGVLPSDIKLQHHIILDTNTSIINSGYIFDDYDYPILYDSGIHQIHDTIARRKSYLTPDMGFTSTINSGEYAIDYNTNTIYANSITDCILYWDEVDTRSDVIIKDQMLDLNPINDINLQFNSYFITVTE